MSNSKLQMQTNENQIDTNLLQASMSYDSVTISKVREKFKGLSGSSTFEGMYTSYRFRKKTQSEQILHEKREKQIDHTLLKGTNKSKLKRKIHAFFRLKQSRKFTAFYSISFPQNFPDKSATVVLNNVLTSLRRNSLKFNYIWVVERQKNGTIHFHILVNRFFNVRVVNYLFSKAITKEIQNNNLHHLNWNPKTYNGCDVKYVRNSKNLKAYITKYVTKNEVKFPVRTWGSDRVVSRLFTSISFHQSEVYFSENIYFKTQENEIKVIDSDFFLYIPLRYSPPSRYLKYLDEINELIANETYFLDFEQLNVLKYSDRSNNLSNDNKNDNDLNDTQLSLDF